MANVKSVRALDRGLAVIEVLHARRAATLGDLHLATGFARATLLRLLKTLEERRWVFHAADDGTYRLDARAQQPAPASLRHGMTTLATPILNRLNRRILWPSGIAVRDGYTMLILETERRSSPFIVDRTIIGHRPSLLKSATGRAYLAFCPDDERKHLLDGLRKSGHPDDRLANIPRLIDRIIDETRRNGYGVREPARRTRISDSERDFNAIAVPVIVRKRVIACINALWIEHVMDVEDFAALYLPALRDAANSLARAIVRRASHTTRGAHASVTTSGKP